MFIRENLPFSLFFLDCQGSRRFRLPYGQLLLPWPMVIDHREKSPSRFAPRFYSVGLFTAATFHNARSFFASSLM